MSEVGGLAYRSGVLSRKDLNFCGNLLVTVRGTATILCTVKQVGSVEVTPDEMNNNTRGPFTGR